MIDRECPKCGQMNAAVKYDRPLEQLDLQCMLCGYTWTRKPLDIVRQDWKKLGACEVKTPLEIAQDIIADLTVRRGLRQAWEDIDDDIRDEILTRWVSIISGGRSDTFSEEQK